MYEDSSVIKSASESRHMTRDRGT